MAAPCVIYEKQASNFAVPAVLYKSHSVAFAEGGKEGEGRAETEKTGRPISGGRKEAIGGGRGGRKRREGWKIEKEAGAEESCAERGFSDFCNCGPPPLLFPPPPRTEAIVRGQRLRCSFVGGREGYCAFVQWGV